MGSRHVRTARKIVISALSMLIIFGLAGVAYVMLADRNQPVKTPTINAGSTSPPPAFKPKTPSPNAKEFAAVENIVSPVAIGSNTSVTVDTNAGSACVISVTYNNVASKDSGLAPKKADEFGRVTWSWTIDQSVPVGSWPVKVTCTYNGRAAVVITNVLVQSHV